MESHSARTAAATRPRRSSPFHRDHADHPILAWPPRARCRQGQSWSPTTCWRPSCGTPPGRRTRTGVGPVSAAHGEPWRSCFRPEELTDLLRRHGFGTVRHHDSRAAVDPPLSQRSDALRPSGLARLVHARAEPLPAR